MDNVSRPESSAKEFIVSAAVMYKGFMITGYRHGDCIRAIQNLAGDIDRESIPGREDQGFLTSKNRYVTRAEAFVIAQDNKQIWHTIFKDDKEGILTSEDLY